MPPAAKTKQWQISKPERTGSRRPSLLVLQRWRATMATAIADAAFRYDMVIQNGRPNPAVPAASGFRVWTLARRREKPEARRS